MNLLKFAALYLIISLALYFIMRRVYRSHPVLPMPHSRAVYYFLSFTWGFPMVFLGLAAALVLRICGKKPVKYGWDWCFELDVDWGTELGIFFIAPRGGSEFLKNHEHGHSIQNIYLGIFTPAVVSLPSFLRFWYRRFRTKLNKKNCTAYDDIWFEGNASKSGAEFMRWLNERENNA